MAPDSLGRSADASDVDLLLAIAGQDREAFVALFERYAGRVKGFMIRSGSAAQDADEIAQEVMVSIWRKAATFDPERASPATWIFAIARNQRIDLVRRRARPAPDPEDPLFQPDPEPDGEAHVTAAQRDAEVRARVDELSPEQRDILVAAFYGGLSHGEIAERYDIPLGTVKSRIRLAFRHLRSVLGADLIDGLSDE